MMKKAELVLNWMSREVITVAPDTSLNEAHTILRDYSIRRLPVVDEHGSLVGIVTLGDIREASASDAASLSDWELNYLLAPLKIDKIMTRNPITVYTSDTIAEAASLMLDHKISGLPVIDPANGALVGIITESDIFRMVARTWGEVGLEWVNKFRKN
jgi:acetoin utilization protein AcuB